MIFPLENSISTWKALLIGPKGSLYENGIFELSV